MRSRKFIIHSVILVSMVLLWGCASTAKLEQEQKQEQEIESTLRITAETELQNAIGRKKRAIFFIPDDDTPAVSIDGQPDFFKITNYEIVACDFPYISSFNHKVNPAAAIVDENRQYKFIINIELKNSQDTMLLENIAIPFSYRYSNNAREYKFSFSSAPWIPVEKENSWKESGIFEHGKLYQWDDAERFSRDLAQYKEDYYWNKFQADVEQYYGVTSEYGRGRGVWVLGVFPLTNAAEQVHIIYCDLKTDFASKPQTSYYYDGYRITPTKEKNTYLMSGNGSFILNDTVNVIKYLKTETFNTLQTGKFTVDTFTVDSDKEVAFIDTGKTLAVLLKDGTTIYLRVFESQLIKKDSPLYGLKDKELYWNLFGEP